jgi:dephospho-CoA kinase
MFAELGAHLISADAIARQVVEPGGPVLAEIERVFGPQVLDGQGRLDRAGLRRRIFGDAKARRRLDALVHPAVAERLREELEVVRAQDPAGVAMVDVPLLFETSTQDRYHAVVVVWAPPETQIQRLMERDGVPRAEAERSLEAQMPLDEKRRRAHFVVDNSDGLQETRNQVEAVWRRLRSLALTQSQP